MQVGEQPKTKPAPASQCRTTPGKPENLGNSSGRGHRTCSQLGAKGPFLPKGGCQVTAIVSASVCRRIACVASALFGPVGAPCGALSTDPTAHDQLQRDEGSQPMTRLINRLLALSFAVGLLAGCHVGGQARFMSAAPVQPWWCNPDTQVYCPGSGEKRAS